MIGKFFVFAFLCVSLTQVQGEGLESAVKAALIKLQNKNEIAERETDYTIKEIGNIRNLLQTKTAIFLEKQFAIEAQNVAKVKATAELFEKKATQANKPPATFECINNAKEKAVSLIEEFGPKFEVDIRRLENTKLNSMEVYARPLEGLKDSLPERYENAVSEVKSAEDVTAVRKTMDKTYREYNLLFSTLRRIKGQVNTAFSQYNRDAGLLISNFSRQASRIQSQGSRDIKNCLYRRSILEE